MNHIDAFHALSARIQALGQALEMHDRRMAINSGDSFAQARRLLEQGRSILQAVQSYEETYNRYLSEPALAAIKRLLDVTVPLVSAESAASAMRQDAATAAVLQMKLFDAEITHLLSDPGARIRAHCERAFEHLRRLIVVDPAQRRLWQEAYANGEPACEGLGATALLYHGIWTFKANATGGRSDLVYSEPIDVASATRAADGLVLTEWKRTDKHQVTAHVVNQLFADARAQSKRYTEGPLAGFELTDYRYIVVVSWEDVEEPAEVNENGIIYRHVNIPVGPLAPSKRRRRPSYGAPV
jgi:hypothetical protein